MSNFVKFLSDSASKFLPSYPPSESSQPSRRGRRMARTRSKKRSAKKKRKKIRVGVKVKRQLQGIGFTTELIDQVIAERNEDIDKDDQFNSILGLILEHNEQQDQQNNNGNNNDHDNDNNDNSNQNDNGNDNSNDEPPLKRRRLNGASNDNSNSSNSDNENKAPTPPKIKTTLDIMEERYETCQKEYTKMQQEFETFDVSNAQSIKMIEEIKDNFVKLWRTKPKLPQFYHNAKSPHNAKSKNKNKKENNNENENENENKEMIQNGNVNNHSDENGDNNHSNNKNELASKEASVKSAAQDEIDLLNIELGIVIPSQSPSSSQDSQVTVDSNGNNDNGNGNDNKSSLISNRVCDELNNLEMINIATEHEEEKKKLNNKIDTLMSEKSQLGEIIGWYDNTFYNSFLDEFNGKLDALFLLSEEKRFMLERKRRECVQLETNMNDEKYILNLMQDEVKSGKNRMSLNEWNLYLISSNVNNPQCLGNENYKKLYKMICQTNPNSISNSNLMSNMNKNEFSGNFGNLNGVEKEKEKEKEKSKDKDKEKEKSKNKDDESEQEDFDLDFLNGNNNNNNNNNKEKEKEKEKKEGSKMKFLCEICFIDHDSLNDVLIFDECFHYYCKNCLKLHTKVKIESRNVRDIRCPHDKCDHKMSHFEVEMVLRNEKDLLVKYDEYLFTNTLEIAPDCKFCPFPNCGTPMFADPNDPMLTCPKCDKKFCFNCGTSEWHSGVTCEAFAQWKIDNDQAEAKFDQWIKKHKSKKCPRCKSFIEKNGGCNQLSLN